LPILNAQLGLLVVSLVNAVVAVACGALSDRIGRRAVLVPALFIYSLLFYVILQRLVAAPTTANLWQLQIVAVLLGALAGPMPAFMTEIFPVGVRSTGASLMYNLAVMLFGGLAPFINTWLVQMTGDKAAPVYYILFAAAVGLIGLSVYRGRRPCRQSQLNRRNKLRRQTAWRPYGRRDDRTCGAAFDKSARGLFNGGKNNAEEQGART
ncbi:MFS transporter, partial [Bradyrhizobium acaciae]|uniref:MFS transporter n=1 Tax=Bradyrhizobium acaciae TaxID=2683706 RepID=UPI001E4F1294